MDWKPPRLYIGIEVTEGVRQRDIGGMELALTDLAVGFSDQAVRFPEEFSMYLFPSF